MSQKLVEHRSEIKPLNLFDERFYPPRNDQVEDVLRYFIVMVALDHRLSRPGKPYTACLEDGCYRGADLLYRLGKKIYDEHREFFDPRHLAEIRVDDIEKYFNYNNARVPDPEVRAYLLRDLGAKILKLYDGMVSNIIRVARGKLRGTLSSPGLIDLLKVFRAYEDPVEKKPFLLAKFLYLRRLFNIVDMDNMEVPVDNHLSRIAYRTGLVTVKGALWDYIKSSKPVPRAVDVLLRLTVRYAYKRVSMASGINPVLLDDLLWTHGRSKCLRDEEPLCQQCIFRDFCKAYYDREFMVSEHIYYDTWYY